MNQGLPSMPLGGPLDEQMDLNELNTKSIDSITLIDQLLNSYPMEHSEPWLEITEQPKPKDHRFRYPCEGRTAGALLGVRSTQKKKTCPEVKVQNLTTRAMIVGSLVTNKGDKPHPFRLVGNSCEDGIVKKIVDAKSPKAKFESLGIQCVKRADLKDALIIRKNLNVDPFQNIDDCIEEDLQDLECKVVRICFQGFLENPNCPGRFIKALDPVVTDNIYNKKDSNLKIMRINKDRGKAKGKDEIYLFCEKVDKDDIQVVFYQESEQECIWTDNGLFGPTDVHHQIAIVFKTPKYMNTEIDREIEVKMSLKRPSDGDMSEPITFIYTPEESDPEEIGAKRKRQEPDFGKCFQMNDNEPSTSGLSSSAKVKKKLQDKIRARSKKTSSKNKDPVKQESPFSFPLAADGCVMSVRSETSVGHVIVKTEQKPYTTIPPEYIQSTTLGEAMETDMATNNPDAFGIQTINLSEVPIVDLSQGLGNTELVADGATGSFGTPLSADQLASILNNMNSHPDPLLSQHNDIEGNIIQPLSAMDIAALEVDPTMNLNQRDDMHGNFEMDFLLDDHGRNDLQNTFGNT